MYGSLCWNIFVELSEQSHEPCIWIQCLEPGRVAMLAQGLSDNVLRLLLLRAESGHALRVSSQQMLNSRNLSSIRSFASSCSMLF